MYPRKFCTAVCAGMATQKKLDDLGVIVVPLMSVEEMKNAAGVDGSQSLSEAWRDEHDDGTVAFDDLTGNVLKPSLMKLARKDEIKYFKDMGAYEKVSIDEAFRITGKAPIAVRWVDVNKGDSTNPRYRSRLVAKEFNTGVSQDLYAATPPVECLWLMLSMLACSQSRDTTLMYSDVSGAYFYAKAERPVYVKLPEEDWNREMKANVDVCRWLCTARGTRH